jgi:hypothetical protein
LVLVSILIFALAYGARVPDADSDPFLSLVVSQQIVERQTVRLDALQGRSDLLRDEWVVQAPNGHYYYYWPVGTSVLSMPFVWVANLLGMDMTTAEHNHATQNLISALSCVLVFAIVYRLGRCYLDWRASLVIASVSVLGSTLISTLGTALWSINFAVVFLGLALLQVAHLDVGGYVRSGPGRARPYVLGLCLFGAYFTRPSTSVFIAIVLAYLFLRDRQVFVRTALTAGLLLLPFLGFSWLEYGRPIPVYSSLARFRVHTTPPLVALYGHFLSPSRGLLVFSPFLVVVALGALVLVPNLRRNAVFWLCAVSFGLTVVVASRATRWWGGHSFGPRILTEALPVLVLMTVVVWKELLQRHSQRSGGVPWSRLAAAGYLLLGLLAILIHSYQGLYNLNTHRWNGAIAPDIDRHPEYLFDWRYPQFLATTEALCARNRQHIDGGLEQGLFDLATFEIGDRVSQAVGYDRIPPPAEPTNGAPDASQGDGAVPRSSEGDDDPANLNRAFLPLVLRTLKNAVFAGWSAREHDTRWSECALSRVVIELGAVNTPDQSHELAILAGSFGAQRTTVLLNGSAIGDLVVPGSASPPSQHILTFEGSLLKPYAQNEIEFVMHDAVSPGRKDPRLLGLNLVELVLRASQ